MAYRIAVCDDSAADREYTASLVRAWAAETDNQVSISLFSSGENFLFRAEDEGSFDILLLDIEMGTLDGVTLAKRLRQKSETLQIVFITGYSDYIAEGYEVSALHYLMKPVKKEKLFSVLSRAAEKLHRDEKALHLESGGQLVRIPVYTIRYADVQGNYVTVHANRDFTAKMTLSDLEKGLDDRFYRVGRSAIVNLTKISRVTKTEILLQDGATVPLPRGAYDGVNRAIINLG